MEDFNDGFEAKLASRMRKVNPEQFFTLVKMHLSFELDINSDDNDSVAEKAKLRKWGFLNFSKKPKSMMNLQQKGSDNITLTLEGINQIKQLIEYLSKEQCINQEGIFRRTGKLTRQQELKTNLLQGCPITFDDCTYNVHDYASVLKTYLADLPEPLLTELHYPAHCQIADLCNSTVNEPRLLRSLQLLLLLLPLTNRILFKYIIILLNTTANFEKSNKMNCDSLATLFTPHLMCSRKLSPEALHTNSQNLSRLVAFMIKKGKELFDIPLKLATDIRAYWVEQERKLLSPSQKDMNESVADMTSTAHTVFSFVDHKLTAKANSTDDTQAALAELYAHIQAMPESAKKRRLVKQFNKENGQGTPRHVKHDKTKSLGGSIKKHIFNKKLRHKRIIDINIGCTSNDENVLSDHYISYNTNDLGLSSKKLFSKSDNDLNLDNDSIQKENIVNSKNLSSSTGILDVSTNKFNYNADIFQQKNDEINLSSQFELNKLNISDEMFKKKKNCLRRCNSEPINIYSSQNEKALDPISPLMKNKFDNVQPKPINSSSAVKTVVFNTCTSTPSDFLRRNAITTPFINKDNSMSPITQSTTKMTKAMQETMMTPRSRKPVIMISGSNLCNLASLDNEKKSNNQLKIVDIDIDGNNDKNIGDNLTSIENDNSMIQPSISITSTFREYLLSRSVLTASPVDLSFTSRTDDFEQSESDINMFNDKSLSDSLLYCLDGNTPNSEKGSNIISPRKRLNTLQRSDSKKSNIKLDDFNESSSNSKNLHDTFKETSF